MTISEWPAVYSVVLKLVFLNSCSSFAAQIVKEEKKDDKKKKLLRQEEEA